MSRFRIAASIVLGILGLISVSRGLAPTAPAAPAVTTNTPDDDTPYFEACKAEGLSDSACVGRIIWFKDG